MSKAAKKNKKKLQKKATHHGGDNEDTSRDDELKDILAQLKDRLAIAKKDQDHKTAGKLREQIWIMNDIIAGIRTDMPEDEIRQILEGVPLPEARSQETAPPPAPASMSGGLTGAGLSEPEKRIRTLKKKLQQIEKIKEKQSKGEKLEKNQIEKLGTEKDTQDELDELETLVAKAMSNLSVKA